MERNDKSTYSASEILDLMRIQKHDFLNYLQVVSGLLQLDKKDRALSYLRRAVEDIERTGTIMLLGDPELALSLLLRVDRAHKKCINVSAASNTDLLGLKVPREYFTRFCEKIWDIIEGSLGDSSGNKEVDLLFGESPDSYNMSVKVCCLEAMQAEKLGESFSALLDEARSRLECKSVVYKDGPVLRVIIEFPR